MKALWKGFSSYTVVAVASAIIHWQVFFVLTTAAEFSQAASNFAAYCVAASFSFYVHVLYTFDGKVSISRYLLFIVAMAALSYSVGLMADTWSIPGLMTVTLFSLLSLIAGLFFLKFLAPRDEAT